MISQRNASCAGCSNFVIVDKTFVKTTFTKLG